MLCKTGWASLTYPSGGSPQQSVTGICFRPKVVLIWMTDSSSPLGYGGAGYAFASLGWTLGPSQSRSQNLRYDASSVAFSDTDFTTLGGGQGLDANLFSFDDDGFTLSLRFYGNYHFFYMALGGDDLQVASGHFQTPPSPTLGAIPVTGLGFKPDFLLAQNGQDDNSIGCTAGWGMASSPSAQAAMSSSRWIFGSLAHGLFNGVLTCPWDAQGTSGGGGVANRVKLTSFDSDGFTVDVVYNNFSSANNREVYWLALKDPTSQFKVGIDTQPVTPVPKAVSGVGFRPGGGIFFGSNKTVPNDTVFAGLPPLWNWGAADGAGHQSYVAMFTQPGSGSDENTYQANDAVIVSSQIPNILLAKAALASWDADGFTLDWSVADAVARYFIYGVFATTKADPCLDEWVPQIYRLKRP